MGLPPREAAVAKAPGAFRTIGEVAEDLDVPQHVLRFWETRFPQIRPLKRGGGRRYYRREDVDLVRGVRVLLYGQGYTIKGVQRILREGGARQVQAIGRGEATAAPPPVAEPEDGDPATAPTPAPEPTDIDRRAALEGALDELLECRRILAALRADPVRDEGA